MLTVVLLLAAAGCGKKRPLPPSPPPSLVDQARSWEAKGDLEAAAQIYARALEDPAEPRPEEARFRLGMLRATWGAPTWDPAAALELLEPLAQDPASPYARTAAVVTALLRRLEESRRKVEDLEGAVAEGAARGGELESRIRRLEAELRRVREELERLKAVDRRRRRP
ncbi:MAG: hypothetical protein Kow00109_30070 [Acidobacteriota bacterium]